MRYACATEARIKGEVRFPRPMRRSAGSSIAMATGDYTVCFIPFGVTAEGMDFKRIVRMEKRKINDFTIYSDGSALKNGSVNSKGGWATILVDKEGKEETLVGNQKGATNNQMELLGVIEGFERIGNQKSLFIEVVTDSQYVTNGAGSWIRKWVRTKFKGIKNENLWRRLISSVGSHRIKWTWVKGHSGHPYNEKCDILAQATARLL